MKTKLLILLLLSSCSTLVEAGTDAKTVSSPSTPSPEASPPIEEYTSESPDIDQAYKILLHTFLFSIDEVHHAGLVSQQVDALNVLLALDYQQASLWFRRLIHPLSGEASISSKLYGLYGLLLIGIPQAEWDQLAEPLMGEDTMVLMKFDGKTAIQSTKMLLQILRQGAIDEKSKKK